MKDDILSGIPVVPLVQAEDPDVAIEIARALKAGGLTVLEVVLRTDAAVACMEAIIAEVPDVTVGAGTVLTLQQAEDVVGKGAKFIVSPGLNDDVVAYCMNNELDIFPGVVTPTEVQRAWNLGLKTVKFFPARLSGGVPMLKALSSVFRNMSFMPTGGVSASNLSDYLAVPAVVACGGSWLTPQKEIDARNFDAITELAIEALSLAKQSKN